MNDQQTPIPPDISNGNLLAAIASLFVPGLGQLVQGRLGPAGIFMMLAVVVWVLTLATFGWVVNILAALEAALFVPGADNENVFLRASTLLLLLTVLFTLVMVVVVIWLGIGLMAML